MGRRVGRGLGGGTIWIGIDDTDSPRGGCTTWVLTELLGLAREMDVDLIGEPRLVRLNPNIPWKTRGNAALAAHFGVGGGPRRRVGEVGGKPIYSSSRGRAVPLSVRDRFLRAAWERVLRGAQAGEEGTDPALVAVDQPLPAALYWHAVREVVSVGSVVEMLDRRGAWWRTHGSERGLVGAAAAIAWPGRKVTWELTAYRDPTLAGSPRRVDAGSVRLAARRHRSLFLCDDRRTRRLLVSPHTACPVLFGLRSTRPGPVLRARATIRSEPVDRWVLFRTNQGTGDHLAWRSASALGPYLSARLRATVAALPEVRPGGHVVLRVRGDDGGRVECLAFEPTKTLPRVARQLVPGDRLVVWGSRSQDPVLRLEGLRLVHLAPRQIAGRPPRCPACSRSTHSLGRGRGYRCPSCHRRFPPEERPVTRLRHSLRLGEYHPTPSARRHLAPRAPER
jgi:tRNA(Ile2)-agmatinylcytidine synthase